MFQSSVARLTLLGALVVGGLVMLERVTEPAPQRLARERTKSRNRPGASPRAASRAAGGPAQSAIDPFDVSLRNISANSFSLN